MHRVLENIDQHLDEQLELDTLAKVANFSSFHFHRLFTAWFGETLGGYVRRRKLEVAAMRLVVQPRLAVTQVALSVGFGSTEALSTARASRHGRPRPSGRRFSSSNASMIVHCLSVRSMPVRYDGSTVTVHEKTS